MTDYLDLTTEANVLPTIVAAETLGALRSNMALTSLVSRDFDNELAIYGQTVNVGLRGTLTVNDKAEGSDVSVQAPTTTLKSVSLDKHKEITFGEEDIAIMLARPDAIAGYAADAAIAILQKIESQS